MRIILADDHVMIREGLKPFVERAAPGASVLEAGSLPEIISLLGSFSPVDLVVLDLRMPGMNGFEGLMSLRAAHPNLRLVILSGIADQDSVREAMRLGANGYIPKHLSGAAMVSALQLVLNGELFIPSVLMEPPTGKSGNIENDALLRKLTPRERDILRLLREGLPNKVIANRLNVTEVTVKSHLGSAFRKLGVQSRLQAMRLLMDRELY